MKFIPCDKWLALPPKTNAAESPFNETPAVGIVIHNTEEEELDTPAATARAIQRAHFDRGFRDTGQHFTVTKDGTVLEGRHGSMIAAIQGLVVQGAHAGSGLHNKTYFGIELCGDNRKEYVVTQAQWDATVALCQLLNFCAGKVLKIIGHMEVHDTTCPGLIMDHLEQLREEVGQ